MDANEKDALKFLAALAGVVLFLICTAAGVVVLIVKNFY